MRSGWWIIAGLLSFGVVHGVKAQESESSDGASDAPASDPAAQERARRHFEAGSSHYDAGSYEDALREFERAYELSGRPQLLYNLSLCHRNLNQLEQSLSFLVRYLQEVEDIPNRSILEARVRNLEARIARRGSGTSTATRADPPAAREAPASAQGGGLNAGAIAGFSIAAAGLVGAAVFGGLTLAEDADLDAACSPNCGDVSQLQGFALATDISFAVALAGATVGLIFLIAGGGESNAQASVVPWVAPASGGVAAQGVF